MKISKLSLATNVLLSLALSQSAFAAVSGAVYRDLPVNSSSANTYGVKEANELGVAGVTVTAQPDGLSTTTAADGSWSLATTTASRIEFSAWPSYLYESADGGVANSSVQFVADNTVVNFGLHNPADFSQVNPKMSTTEFISGDPLGGGTAAGFDAWFLFNDNDEGIEDSPAPSILGSIANVGAVWGVAYQKSTQTAFASAVLRRHSGFGTIDGSNTTTGGIYAANISGSATAWLDVNTLSGVNTGADPRNPLDPDNALQANADQPTVDLDAFALVGKIGLGDIDVSEDDTKLYAINLNSRELLTIDIATKALDSRISITDPGCSNGDYRPWAVEENDGELYVGVTCSAETSQNASDLAIHVMKLSGATFTTVFSETTMDYSRDDVGGGLSNSNAVFGPWRLNWNDLDHSSGWPTGDPAPVLSDIQFDIDGSLILAINDITGLQIGAKNYKAIAGNTDAGPEGVSGGDILRACPNGSGGWVMESNGSCGGVNGAGVGNGFGPSGGEFYNDFGLGAGGDHKENVWGGSAFLPGSGRVSYTGMDPHTAARAGGVMWLDNNTGNPIKGYEIYDDAGYSGAEFSKAAGIGDVELLADPAPLEIGNRVWDDTNNNGTQDADEAGISGILVTLTCGGLTATATSDADGHWLISDGDMTGGVDIPRETSCSISVPMTEPSGNSLTTQTLGTTLGSDPDSNGSFTFTTGRSGQNNHSYDIGYSSVPPVVGCTTIDNTASITAVDQTDTDNTNDTASASIQANCATPQADLELVKTADKTQVLKGDTLIYTLTLTNKGDSDATDVEVTDTLPINVTFINATPAAGTTFDNASKVWTIPSLPAASGSNAVTLQIEVTVN